MIIACHPGTRLRRADTAFTLLEVMIAMAIFFVAMFSILELVSQGLRSARMLGRHVHSPNAGLLAAELSLTNRLEEGTDAGDFGEDFPSLSWTREIVLDDFDTNGVYFRVDWFVYRDGKLDSTLSTQMYRPQSGQRTGGGRR
jgi:prepilin-type N-terminal cleavage/methylation domain-containing protein